MQELRMPELHAIRLPGLTPYEPAWRLQHRLARARREGAVPDLLLLLEHPPVYTVGRGGRESEILLDGDARRRLGVEVHHIDRGGRVTYHGPGQLVGYGIVDLRHLPGGVHRYLRSMEAGLIAALARLGIEARRQEGLTGVWAGEEKIAAIGIRVTRGVTMHGFALNVHPDLSFFAGIIPCGIRDRGVTSIRRLLGQAPGLDAVARIVAEELARALGRRLVWEPDTMLLAPYQGREEGGEPVPGDGDGLAGAAPAGSSTGRVAADGASPVRP